MTDNNTRRRLVFFIHDRMSDRYFLQNKVRGTESWVPRLSQATKYRTKTEATGVMWRRFSPTLQMRIGETYVNEEWRPPVDRAWDQHNGVDANGNLS